MNSFAVTPTRLPLGTRGGPLPHLLKVNVDLRNRTKEHFQSQPQPQSSSSQDLSLMSEASNEILKVLAKSHIKLKDC
jgi:hypothetical protein